MGPRILIPVLLLVIIVPLVSWWAKKRFKDGHRDAAEVVAPTSRLTSNALRELPSPQWRVVHEISPDKLSGIEHVLIGPPGAFAVVTVLEPLPTSDHTGDQTAPDAHELARVAITRGGLDDALRRCALTSAGLVRVHWGVAPGGSSHSFPVMHGVVAVDGRRLGQWAAHAAAAFDGTALTPAQIDLAWQTVLTTIGRPDPLA